MVDVSCFYRASDQHYGTHLALHWNGRVRFIVPRDTAGQKACWKLFHPGPLAIPLRAMARLPRLLGVASCVEDEKMVSIRQAIGNEAERSCCRIGAPGPWSKDTILLLDYNAEPLYIVKAGTGEAVDSLLRNEAKWLRMLRGQSSLIDHIPDFVTHRSGADLSFVAESPLSGKLDYNFGELHIAFLRKLHEYSRQAVRLEDSRLYRNLRSRLKSLSGLLSEEWSTRLDAGMRRIEQSLSGAPVLLVAAHNDFTPWNIRVQRDVVRIFDWEYADYEQLPLFDPLHFAMLPMALKRRSTARMVQHMQDTLRVCRHQLGEEYCYNAPAQVLTYLMNLCTLYLWAERGNIAGNRVLESYARVIDYLSHI